MAVNKCQLTDEKISLIVDEYFKADLVKSVGLVNAGYSKSYATSGIGLRLYANIRVKAEIERVMAAKKAKDELTIESINKGFAETLAACNLANDRVNACRVLENQAKHVGYYEKDNVQTTQQRELSDSEAVMAKQIAAIVNREGIKLHKPEADKPEQATGAA